MRTSPSTPQPVNPTQQRFSGDASAWTDGRAGEGGCLANGAVVHMCARGLMVVVVGMCVWGAVPGRWSRCACARRARAPGPAGPQRPPPSACTPTAVAQGGGAGSPAVSAEGAAALAESRFGRYLTARGRQGGGGEARRPKPVSRWGGWGGLPPPSFNERRGKAPRTDDDPLIKAPLAAVARPFPKPTPLGEWAG